MREIPQVPSPPLKPLLVFDGDCGFCRRWIARWQQVTGDRVDYLPFQDQQVAARFPELPQEQFRRAVLLIEPDGRVYGGAEAVFRSLAHAPGKRWMLRAYQTVPGAAPVAEWSYGVVARRRGVFSALTRFARGPDIGQPTDVLVRWVFLRLLGVVYFIAFVSLGMQIPGLVGSHGIQPAQQLLDAVREWAAREQIGWDRYRLVPTLCWLSASDHFLKLLCGGGTVLSVLLIVGVAPAPVLWLLWAVYLSLSTVCREFLSFQWDALLLETGLLAIFFAPLQLLPGISRETPPSRTVLWLLRWLLFRLMFSSGVVKLTSGDPTWRNLAALTFHYETQPLPTWIGWYAHQLPASFHRASVVGVFAIELGVPFLILAPRRLRMAACGPLVALQVLIALTGNYAFFDLLTAVLCVLLLDDAALRGMLPARWRGRVSGPRSRHNETPARRWPQWLIAPIAAVVLIVSTMEMLARFGVRVPWPAPMVRLDRGLAPFESINGYGLFAVMTTSRPEIIVEGSHDGTTWLAYELKYKPGDVARRPAFVAPYQPRLDWQMWFAALGSYEENRWFIRFCTRLLEGSPEVLALLGSNPFASAPPRYIRAVVYDYRFTDLTTRRADGTWWRRELRGPYSPVMSLREP